MSLFTNRWTNGLTITLPPEKTVTDLVGFVVDGARSGSLTYAETSRELRTTFGLTPQEADVVRDRVLTGVIRAATGHPALRPDPTEDPFASAACEHATREPAVIQAFAAQYAWVRQRRGLPSRPWWRFWK